MIGISRWCFICFWWSWLLCLCTHSLKYWLALAQILEGEQTHMRHILICTHLRFCSTGSCECVQPDVTSSHVDGSALFWSNVGPGVSCASYQIRKIAGWACAGNAGNVFPRRRFQRKPLVSDPGMHNGTCVTHVPWCMSESLTCGDGENVPGISGACAPVILRFWQEAHAWKWIAVSDRIVLIWLST